MSNCSNNLCDKLFVLMSREAGIFSIQSRSSSLSCTCFRRIALIVSRAISFMSSLMEALLFIAEILGSLSDLQNCLSAIDLKNDSISIPFIPPL